jgi:hypothetical protein
MLSFEMLGDARNQRMINHWLLILPGISVEGEITGSSVRFDDCVTRGQ